MLFYRQPGLRGLEPCWQAVLSSQPVVVGQHRPWDGCGCVTQMPPARCLPVPSGGSGPSGSINGSAAFSGEAQSFLQATPAV